METILEVVRIEQIIREAEEGVNYINRSPDDGAKIASRFIGRDDREVFFVIYLNTENNVIAVLDHLVVNSDNSFTSLKERGYI
ncbi:hypothetical protein ACSBQ0_17295 [Bacillus altitudinis]|uniref:hypothetical protein n=1 Tax=Bacillus TaxID=1386 RepID=UPI0021045BAA|nr:hypothetical protein [Bacillus sp. FS02]